MLVVMMLFYRSWPMLTAGAVLGGILCPGLIREELLERQKTGLSEEFQEALYDLMVGLRSGRSLEGAFLSAAEDMDPWLMPLLYEEWTRIGGQIRLGIPVEQCLQDLAERSGMEEMETFARSVEVCKRSEGNIALIMENTVRMLQDRMELRAELKVLLAKKKLEQRIMTVMPFVILGMLILMSPDYLAPLYTSVRGYLIMAVCGVITVFSVLLSRKMVRIDL